MSLQRAEYSFPTEETYAKIVSALKLPKRTSSDAVPRWVKCCIRKKFKLSTVCGNERVIDIKMDKPILVRSFAPQVLRLCHDDAQHPGRAITEKNIAALYAHVPRSVIATYIKACEICSSRKPQHNPPPSVGQMIVSKGVMYCLGLDFMDMEPDCDGNVRHVIHMKCHFSKFTWAHPLVSKADVVDFVRNVFYMFGTPAVLQIAKNGEAFTGSDFETMLKEFPDTEVLTSGSRMERANHTLQKRLGSWIQVNGCSGWSHALPKIVSDVNGSFTQILGTTPFEVMFSRRQRPDVTAMVKIDAEFEIDSDNETGLKCEPTMQPEVIYEQIKHSQPTPEPELLCKQTKNVPLQSMNKPRHQFQNHEVIAPTNVIPIVILFSREPFTVHAIALDISSRIAAHGKTETERLKCFQILEIISKAQVMDDLWVGAYTLWDINNVARGLGTDLAQVKNGLPQFIIIMQNKLLTQQGECNIKYKGMKFSVGDTVAMKIPKCNRSTTCRNGLTGQIISIAGNFLKLKTNYGVISEMIPRDEVEWWDGHVDFSNAADNVININTALHQHASFAAQGNSVCRCTSECNTLRCPCKRASFVCSTKCHNHNTRCTNKQDIYM